MSEERKNGRELEAAADDQFVHGLLTFLSEDDDGTQERRLALTMAAVDRERGEGSRSAPRPMRRGPSLVLMSSMAALVLAIAAGYVLLSGGPSPQELVIASLEASEESAGGRYDFQAAFDLGQEQLLLNGRLDVGEGEQRVIEVHLGEHLRLTAGRDLEGDWVIHQDGSVERFEASAGAPLWVELHRALVPLASIDRAFQHVVASARQHGEDESFISLGEAHSLHDKLIEHLHGTHPDHGTGAVDEFAEGEGFHKVMAVVHGASPSSPEHADLWIHPDDHRLHRMVLHWPPAEPDAMQMHALHTLNSALSGGGFEAHFLHAEDPGADGAYRMPDRVVFTLVGHPDLPADWFAPEAHTD